MTDISRDVRMDVLRRAGWCCEFCGEALSESMYDYSIQHRDGRGMGGTKRAWINMPENLIALCGSATTGCHGYVEGHPLWAYARGLALRTGSPPEETPFCDTRQQWWLLIEDRKVRLQLPFDLRAGRMTNQRTAI